jgi:proteasome lid subunit RPN8/RPN11
MAVDETNRETPSKELKPDLDSVGSEDWETREFPINSRGQRNYVQVIIRRSVLNEIHEHGQSDTDVEVCGVLVGDGYRDERGPFLYVEIIVQGEHSDSKAAQVTFTAETWNHIQTTLDQDYPEKRIVGWYHTHPGFGIFLSEMDMFIHENFFGGDEQLALVYDPIGGDLGLFVWREGKAIRERLLVEEDVDHHSDAATNTSDHPAMTAAADQESSGEMESRLSKLEWHQNVTLAALFFVTILAIGWPIAASQLGLFEANRDTSREKPAEKERRQAPPPRRTFPSTTPKQVDSAPTTKPPQKKVDDGQPDTQSPPKNPEPTNTNENNPSVEPNSNQRVDEPKSDAEATPTESSPVNRDDAKNQP